MEPANKRFSLGTIRATSEALKVFNDKYISPISFLAKHQSKAPQKQKRVISAHKIGTQRIFIITEIDKSLTTILLDRDY